MSDMTPIRVSSLALDRMMPLHMIVGLNGVIRHVGPTMKKVLGDTQWRGVDVYSLFELRRPRADQVAKLLRNGATGKLLLKLKAPPATQFIGTAVTLPGRDGILVNLSFGIATFDAIADYRLADRDFAPTDLTMELLYVAEANAAAMAESRGLNERLDGQKSLAEAEAMTDTLTGLKNRRALDQVLHRLIDRNTPFTLGNLDLDFFKAVNDTHGHAAGDRVLEEVARILLEETREDDTVARVGGDEFVLLFTGLTDRKRLSAIAGRMIRRLEQPVPFEDKVCKISASIGLVSTTQYDRPDGEQMMQDADLALYASKEKGRARFTFATVKNRGNGAAELVTKGKGRAGASRILGPSLG